MCNVWRSTHMATRIFKAWASMFGHPRALRACRRLPGKPIAGRWGAVHSCESFLINAGQEETRAVLTDVLVVATAKSSATKDAAAAIGGAAGPAAAIADKAGKSKSTKSTSSKANADEAFAIVFDEQKEHTERMTKWTRSALRSAQSDRRLAAKPQRSAGPRIPSKVRLHFQLFPRRSGSCSGNYWAVFDRSWMFPEYDPAVPRPWPSGPRPNIVAVSWASSVGSVLVSLGEGQRYPRAHSALHEHLERELRTERPRT